MLKIVPAELKEANAFVDVNHRHHKPVQGHRFSIGVSKGEVIVGYATVGRPVSRCVNHHEVLEVTRLVTDGTPNACSKLYSACARIGKGMGYKKMQTYILDSEPGTSLRAAGWKFDGYASPSSFSMSRKDNIERKIDTLGKKQRWVKEL
jgi:hypothetical protein